MTASTFRNQVPAATVLVTPDHQLVGFSFADGNRADIAERIAPGCTLGFIQLEGPIPDTARRLDLHPAPAPTRHTNLHRGIVRYVES